MISNNNKQKLPTSHRFANMEDFSRCFPVPPPPSAPVAPIYSPAFDSVVNQLTTHCWDHYERRGGRITHQHSLYIGSLGPCAYVRYRLAQSIPWNVEDETRERKQRLLLDASRAIDVVLDSEPSGSIRRMRVTLLEGKHVGALALSAAVNHSLEPIECERATSKVSRAKNELLDIGKRYVKKLDPSECEVLYGRAGYLHAIAFVRSETNDHDFGKELVLHTVKHICKEGEKMANEYDTNLPLLWEWHGKAYLGAIHGAAGILFTLLCFYEEVSSIDGAVEKIKAAIAKLNELCFASGNLKSLFGAERDKLVHLCHGASGQILLLAKAYEVLQDRKYLESAERIATKVMCRRGLLKKGVGLCHGISGNAYCFLALYRARRLLEQRIGDSSNKESINWLCWAHHFAKFAVDRVNDLFPNPDHPHSLYEGASGLIMLLHDLKDPDHSSFPCFEPRT